MALAAFYRYMLLFSVIVVGRSAESVYCSCDFGEVVLLLLLVALMYAVVDMGCAESRFIPRDPRESVSA